MNSPYFGFIFAAYAIGFTVIAVMIVATLLDYRSLKRQLAKLTARTGRTIDD